ncbi:hypothetical protein SCOCK_10390 [Actinacidiphila cocklensis]|uniref:Uncharacterized protein n=1 Tax=Actinacidiphila cocklensis TaxID=887465 RepID=A0A9W4DIL5_9ACTN|nr:hypothetical protein SCOCK_10390 [Actinacidiphila cocklensis]
MAWVSRTAQVRRLPAAWSGANRPARPGVLGPPTAATCRDPRRRLPSLLWDRRLVANHGLFLYMTSTHRGHLLTMRESSAARPQDGPIPARSPPLARR